MSRSRSEGKRHVVQISDDIWLALTWRCLKSGTRNKSSIVNDILTEALSDELSNMAKKH